MKKVISFFAFLLVLGSSALLAQIGNGSSQISGYVLTDASKGEPVKNVDVILDFEEDCEGGSSYIVTTTASDGSWSFTNLPVGTYTIHLDNGYPLQSSPINIQITVPNTNISNVILYTNE
jgi:hypothetical protein